MSVCLFVPDKLQIDSFFVSRWNRAIFWSSVFHDPRYKTFFFDFWFRLPNAQNWPPKFGLKSPISQLVWQLDRRCLYLPGAFLGWPIQWNHVQCCGADPCCHGNEIWARRGDPVVRRLAQMVSGVYVTIGTYLPEIGNISRGRTPRGIFPISGK